MAHQTPSKKSAGSSKASLFKQKAAKRARTEPSGASKPFSQKKNADAKLTPTTKSGKKPSVSFAQPQPSPSSSSSKRNKNDKQKEKKTVRLENSAASPKPSLKGKASSSKARPPKPDSPSVDALPHGFTIVVGSYEKLLYGIEGTYEAGTESTAEASTSTAPIPTLKPVFIFPAHVASVKALAASPGGGRWLATGSSDEIIKVWDLRRRKEVGGLMQHQGMSFLFPHFSTVLEDMEISHCLRTVNSSTTIFYDRFDNTSVFPIPLPPHQCLRRWDNSSLPRARLDGSYRSERTQGPCQQCRSTSNW